MNKTIECRADLCGREAHLEGKDWYFCKCGWSGSSYDEVAVLTAEVKRLRYHLDLMIEKFGEAYLIETLIERGEEE